MLPVPRCVRAWIARVFDSVPGLANPTPPVILERVHIMADVPVYQPTAIDREVAHVADSTNYPVFLLPAGPRQQRPCYVVADDMPYGRVPPS